MMDEQEYNKIKLLHEQIEDLTKSGNWELDLEGNELWWSAGVYKMLGYMPNEFELTSEKGIQVIHPEDRERAIALKGKVVQEEAVYFIEKRLLTKSGNVIYVRSKANLFKDENGRAIKLIGVFQDISDFVESQKELKQQNSLTQDILRDLPAIFFLFNQSGQILLWNEKLEKVTGFTKGEIATKVPQEFFEGEEKIKIINYIQKTLNEGYTDLEAWLTTKKKGTVPLFITASTIQYKGETCIFGTGTDISERISLLHELQLLVDNTEEAFTYVDEELNILSFNHQMSVHSLLLFQKKLKKGMKITQFPMPNQQGDLNMILKEVWEGHEVKQVLKISSEDPHQFYELKFKPIFSADQKVQGVFITSLNVTEAYKASKALLESQQKLQQVLDSSLDTLCLIDENGIFQMVSRSSEELWGYTPVELEGKAFMDFVIEEDRPLTANVAEQIQQGEQFRNFQNRYRHKEGYIVPVVWSAYWEPEQNLMNCVARDATDQLKAEEQLKLSENRFKALVQEGSDLIVILDLEGNYKYISPSNEGSGFEPEDYTGKNAFDFIHPDDIDWVGEEFRKLENQKNIQIRPYRFLSSKGEWRWMESHVTDLLEEPSVQGIVANSRDVTETVELQQTVSNATKLARVGGWEINQLTGEHIWSSMTAEIHEAPEGFRPSLEQAINFYHPHFRDKVKKAVNEAIQEGKVFDFEAIIITYKGKEKWIRAIGNVEMQAGQCVRIYGSFQDIHERKTAELRLQNISDNIPGVLFQFILKPDGSDSVDLVSKGAEEIFGVTAEQWIEDPSIIWANIEKGGDLAMVQKAIQKSAESMERWEAQWRYIRPNGSVHFLEGFGNPVRKLDGTLVWDSIIVDITEKRKAEEQVRIAKEALEQYAHDLEVSNAELEQFAYIASHDLQEPLRMITGFLTQLEKKYGDKLDEKANQYIFYAVDGARRMRQIILDLLDFSRVGKQDEEIEKIDLNKLVEEVCLLNKRKIEELNAKIEFKNLPTVLEHPSPMIQLFQNLISNALKYNRADITPKVLIKATELKKEWKFSVEDNGIGIEEKYFDKIFNIFQRLHNKSEYSGTGMGLAIVKKIIENQNGKIWLESEKGKGTTFYFTIPKK